MGASQLVLSLQPSISAVGNLEIKYPLVPFQKWVSDNTSYSYLRVVLMDSALSKSSSAWILADKDDKAVSIDGFIAAVMVELVVARFLSAKSTWTENSE